MMDRRKWRREKNRVKIFIKLVEEVGEVGEQLMEGTQAHALKEIDQCVFLLERLRERVKANGTKT